MLPLIEQSLTTFNRVITGDKGAFNCGLKGNSQVKEQATLQQVEELRRRKTSNDLERLEELQKSSKNFGKFFETLGLQQFGKALNFKV